MSLGFTNMKRGQISHLSRVVAVRRMEVETPDFCHKRVLHLKNSCFTYRSHFACGSCLSCCTMLGAFSVFSVLSLGSVLSVLSIGSTLSILSIGSVNSWLSVGSYGCSFKIFANCAMRKPDDGLELDIHIDPDTWATISTCTFDDYSRFKTYDSGDSPCDYQSAMCEYRGKNGFTNYRRCKVRRKGASTWQNLENGPSLKIKFDKDGSGSKDFDFGNVGRERFVADKVTINNMGFSDSWNGYDEVDAYDTFYRLQGSSVPIAARIKTRAFRGTRMMWEKVHALVEDVNNDDYFKRVNATDFLLYEADNRGTELKDADGVWKNVGLDEGNLEDIVNRPSELSTFMNKHEILSYYVADRLLHNWDGALLNPTPRNFYVFVVGNDTKKPHIRYIPKGLDWVFQGCVYDIYTDSGKPYDGPTQHVVDAFPKDLKDVQDYAAEHVPYNSLTCDRELGIATLIVFLSALIVLLVFAGTHASISQSFQNAQTRR